MNTYGFTLAVRRTGNRLKKFARMRSGLLALSLALSLAPLVIWLRADDAPGDSGTPPTGPAAVQTNAFVWTDQGDYAPGTTAQIYGRNFQADESVTLQVVHADGTPDSGADHDPWIVVVASDGTFTGTWHICEDDCVGSTL